MPERKSDPTTLSSSGFVRASAMLISGTAGAQLITAAAMPFLSRLYGPGEFGTLAVFAGIVVTVAVAACLRFDIAVALPDSDSDAFGLLVLSVACAAGTSLAMCAVVAFGSAWIARVTDQSTFVVGAWLMPLGIFTTAACSALQNWNIRNRSFGLMARVRVGQSLAGAGTQLGAGLAGAGPLGLLAGYVANTAVAAAYLGLRMAPQVRTLAGGLTGETLRRLAHTYRRFPAYSTWEALANSAAIHAPIVMIAAVATTTEAGYLMLAMYVIQAPMSLIGSAVGQVYLSKAPQAYRDGNLPQFTVEVLCKLTASGVGPLLAIGILAPLAFGLIFGAGWERAGWLVAWMTPWFVLQFLASPVSMALHVTGHQRAAMALQLFSLITRVSAVWMASLWWPGAVGEVYALSGLVAYAAYLLVVIGVIGVPFNDWLRHEVQSLRWALPWVGGAVLAALIGGSLPLGSQP